MLHAVFITNKQGNVLLERYQGSAAHACGTESPQLATAEDPSEAAYREPSSTLLSRVSYDCRFLQVPGVHGR